MTPPQSKRAARSWPRFWPPLREIDVYADFYDFINREPDLSVQASVTLVIECKNSSGPFVLIGDHGQETPFARDWSRISFDPFSLGFPRAKHVTLSDELRLERLPGLPTGADFVGRQLLRLNRQGGSWKADNSAIYDSILYPLAKAWKYKMEFIEREREEYPEEYWEVPTIRYVFPIIVTSGQLYTVDATDEHLNISQARWAGIKRTFESKEIRGNFRADVVPMESWDDYLDAKIIKVFTGAKEALSKYIHLYDPEWMLSHLGTPNDQEFFAKWLRNHQAMRKAKQENPERKP